MTEPREPTDQLGIGATDMTDRTHPDSGRTTGGIVEMLQDRVAELEAQLEAIGAGGVSGPLMGQPQEMPDLTTLTERGAKAWAGVDAQGLRGGAASAGSEPVAGIYQLSPPASAHDTITEVIKELRTYNPQADEHGGKFIHQGWANQLEAVAPPQISESDAAYWVRNRALILRAIEERGFRLVSSGGLFWLSGPTHPSPPEGMVGGWIALPGALPEPGTPVLLDIGKKYPIRAMWAAKFTLPVGLEDDSGFGEYDERTDEWYCPEGWYEWNEHEETHWRVTAAPRAWAPLPPTSSADSRKGE